MAATFYKTVLRAIVGPEEFNTILYYGTVVPSVSTFDAGIAEDLGTAVGAAWIAEMLPLLPTQYNFQSIDVSMVDQDGVTTSPYVVTVATPGTGASVNTLDTYAQCLIAKFNCTPLAETGHPVPRRSYIAIGPLGSEHIAPGGILLNQSTWQTAVEDAVTGGHLVGATSYVPYRIGRTKGLVSAGNGRVVAVTVRPYTSFRRSRLVSPTGG